MDSSLVPARFLRESKGILVLVHPYTHTRGEPENKTGFIDQYLAVTNNSVRWPVSLGCSVVREKRSYPLTSAGPLSRSLRLSVSPSLSVSCLILLLAARSHRRFISFYARPARYCFPPVFVLYSPYLSDASGPAVHARRPQFSGAGFRRDRLPTIAFAGVPNWTRDSASGRRVPHPPLADSIYIIARM